MSKLPPEIRAAWINLAYAAGTNAQYPDLRRDESRPAYFVDPQSAYPGQWVRVVIQPRRGREFWCVADLAEVIDDTTIRFHKLAYENGASRTPAMFAAGEWKGVAKATGDGAWDVVELEPENPPPRQRTVERELVHADGRRWKIAAVGNKVTVTITLADGELVERTRKTTDAIAEAERLVAEQLADGFSPL